jgi:hypothetical protein
MLFREIFAAYCVNHTKHINTMWAELRVSFPYAVVVDDVDDDDNNDYDDRVVVVIVTEL